MGVGTLTADVATPGKAPVRACQSLASASNLPSHCVAAANLKPKGGSNIKMELWMPASDWNGKLMMIGNDGAVGSIPRGDMADPLRRGYAVVATDAVHSGPGTTDVADWAIHETVVKAKALTAAYYGAIPRYSYWKGSSFGGKQGLKEVQSYAADFDGVIVGAPTDDWMRDAAAADLSLFSARGGKIIQYQVSADAAMPAEKSIDYFERVAATQGGIEQTRSFYRLFVIPALEHANGTYSFDWIAALEEWVEAGRAPDSVLANHIPPPDAALKQPPPGALVFEPPYGIRVMCAYPSVARLQAGLGEVPVDWICQPGPRGPSRDR
jgi:hypothetical protein